ncbi:AAA domain-containing protein [Baffinella frigidus]|nr:AAA domain-containing protein [Cryptophyta sp. CCMP2293]
MTPYRGQVGAVQAALRAEGIIGVEVSTIDSFQGREVDVAVLSCVRAGPQTRGLGFVADLRRLNVALTRARATLLVVGDARALSQGSRDWAALVAHAEATGSLKRLTSEAHAAECFAAPPSSA